MCILNNTQFFFFEVPNYLQISFYLNFFFVTARVLDKKFFF